MKTFSHIGKFLLLLSFLAIFSCSSDNEVTNIDQNIKDTSTVDFSRNPILINPNLRAFQITYIPDTDKYERRRTRRNFMDDPYTTFISHVDCGSDSDIEVWYMEVHPEHAPPACPVCSGPKSAASHIEDEGGDLSKTNYIDQALDGVDNCDPN